MVLSLNKEDDLIKSDKKTYQCPKCKSEFDARVRRSSFVKIFLFWLPLRRYACYNCKRKFYVWS